MLSIDSRNSTGPSPGEEPESITAARRSAVAGDGGRTMISGLGRQHRKQLGLGD